MRIDMASRISPWVIVSQACSPETRVGWAQEGQKYGLWRGGARPPARTRTAASPRDGEQTRNKSFCRLCYVGCPIVVETDGRTVLSVKGDRDNPIIRGYACIKGRTQGALYDRPERLLRPL